MNDQADGEPLEVRPPDVDDLVRIARALEAAGAHYVLIGGFAVISHGFARTTKDIDLLVDPSPDNMRRIKEALSILEDNAAADIEPDDLARYTVIRVADEVMVDLLASACGITWRDAAPNAVHIEVRGQVIIVADPDTLIATKRTVRPSDAQDRQFLERLLLE